MPGYFKIADVSCLIVFDTSLLYLKSMYLPYPWIVPAIALLYMGIIVTINCFFDAVDT